MLGGHLDSWHSATGATDNAIGCAIMMEAARILKALGVQPRRTIRVALWSGEEEGLLGSQAYVKEHFGTFESAEAGVREVRRLPEHRHRHRPRCAAPAVFGPPEAATILRADPRAVRGSRRRGAIGDAQPRHRRHRQHVVQQRGPAGHRLQPGSDRVQQPHAPHEPRHLRAHHRGGRPRRRRRRRRHALSAGDARRDAAALRRRQDAARAAAARQAATDSPGRRSDGLHGCHTEPRMHTDEH